MASEDQEACSVTQAMNAAKRGLEQIRLRVVGEVSEFNDKAGYKAAYFTVKDEKCSMDCIMWRGAYDASGVELRVGMLVEMEGRFSCYPAQGRMQFSVSHMSMAGEGDLRLKVAQIAKMLQAEGLMDQSRKRKLPVLPERVALVTSPRGKAVHDVLRTIRRHYPLCEVMLFGVAVEGKDAPAQIIEGLHAAAANDPAPELILLVRGGGSYEALMPFNDEALAREVAASPIPVITGIGHEPDHSICDMVSDFNCITPTAAATAVAPSVAELQGKVNNATSILSSSFSNHVSGLGRALEQIASHPMWRDDHYLTGSYSQTLDLAGERLSRAIPDAMRSDKASLESLGQRLSQLGAGLGVSQKSDLSAFGARLNQAGSSVLRVQRDALALKVEKLRSVGAGMLQGPSRSVALTAAKLDALSPLKTLARGYSITYAQDGHTVVDSVDKTEVGSLVAVQVQDGSLECTVQSIERGA